MKNKFLRLIAIIAAIVPAITIPKSSKEAFSPETIKATQNIYNYPIFESNFLAIQFFKGLKKVPSSTIELQDTPENISKAKHTYGIENFTNNNFITTPLNNKKIVLYISPSHGLSVKDFDKYLSNNIAVLNKHCTLNSPLENHKKGYKNSTTLVGAFLRWISGNKKNPYTKPYKICSLLSDTNKIIDIYTYKVFGCDAKFYFTSHPTPIAILIDEKGTILNILDNVQSEQNIYNAFGV